MKQFIHFQLASIPGLEEVTVDGVRPSAVTNGPAVEGSCATGPPVEVTLILIYTCLHHCILRLL